MNSVNSQGNGWRSRKLVVVFVAFLIEVALAFGVDVEVAKAFGAFIAALGSAYMLGQGIADSRVAPPGQ